MVIWLSGLQTISPTLYEAADIEGASKWQTFRYVTWPGLSNTAILILIVITMQASRIFAQIDVMTNGGPLDSTQTLVFQAVERGYGKQDISGGSTISVILFLIVLSISLVQRWLTRERLAWPQSLPRQPRPAAGLALRRAGAGRDHLRLPAPVHGDVVAEAQPAASCRHFQPARLPAGRRHQPRELHRRLPARAGRASSC